MSSRGKSTLVESALVLALDGNSGRSHRRPCHRSGHQSQGRIRYQCPSLAALPAYSLVCDTEIHAVPASGAHRVHRSQVG